MTEPAPKPVPQPLTPRQALVDRIVFFVVMFVGLLGAAGLLFSVLAAVAKQAGCDPAANACEAGVATIGFYIGAVIGGGALIATIIVAIVRWVRGRLVWPVAVAGMVLIWIGLLVGQTVATYADRAI